jgi:hypothetical protein
MGYVHCTTPTSTYRSILSLIDASSFEPTCKTINILTIEIKQGCGLADPHNFDADPDPSFYLDEDPCPTFQFNADLVVGF